jgi:hypothetical protein
MHGAPLRCGMVRQLETLTSLREKEQVMSWNQIAENWNGQVTKLFNWTINRLESAADKTDVRTTQTHCQLPSVKLHKHAG